MEYLVMVLILVVSVCIGMFAGILIGTNRFRKAVEEQSVGCLRIDRSEPDEPPKPFLELQGATIYTISQKKFVMLKVVNENYLSRD